MYRILLLATSAVFFVCCGKTTKNEVPQRDYVIVIHGGAGNSGKVAQDSVRAATYYAALDSALTVGYNVIEGGGDGVATVIEVIKYLENNPLFNAGKGATCTIDGKFQLDASIMTGKDLNAGAVAGVMTVKNPITAAYAVMTRSPHVMLVADGADKFAAENGLELVEDNSYFRSSRTDEYIEALKKEKHGTVGCVVLDRNGDLVAGTSTGGIFKKQYGRVGDSPIIGAGTYADNESCAVSCTGDGEYYIRNAVAVNICARYKYMGESVEQAADHMIDVLSLGEGRGGIIAVDKSGNIAMPFNTTGMFRGYLYKEKGADAITKRVGIGATLK
jgi:beta-aspartyl-peptidase (threonine type)